MRNRMFVSAVIMFALLALGASPAQAGTASATVPCGSSTPDFHGTYNHVHSGGSGSVSSVSWSTSFPQNTGTSFHTLDVIVNHSLYKRVQAQTTTLSGVITISSGTHTQITMRWKIAAALDGQICGPVDTVVIT